jgi:hypothetical protein
MPNGDCPVGSANSARIEAAQATLESALRELERECAARDRGDRELAEVLKAESGERRKADKEIAGSIAELREAVRAVTDWKNLLAAALTFLIASGAGSVIGSMLTGGGGP